MDPSSTTSSPPPPPKTDRVTAVRNAAYLIFRVVSFLFIVSRIYSLLIAYDIVPNYPDPILAFLASTYARFNALLESTPENRGDAPQGNDLKSILKALRLPSLLLGNAVFGGMLRYYSPPPAPAVTEDPSNPSSTTPSSKRAAKKQAATSGGGGMLKQVQAQQEETNKSLALKNLQSSKEKLNKKGGKEGKENDASDLLVKRKIVIVGRLAQCFIFLYAGFTSASSRFDKKVLGVSVNKLRPVLDTAVGMVLVWAETNGVSWDLGVFDMLFMRSGEEKAVEGEEVVREEDVSGAKIRLR